ncbi:CYFA0S06e02894g1_1 [Cyberlindnera fabianii]|uniref:CYFA0S06e02894g1_1 n=1 Tax=Cyberlindnera fabianii TaxID=36022 RepID=A0A061AVF0_CYBFA|nr:CYFA0S06e02894g1_1 [Cyberlindnera fabianii]
MIEVPLGALLALSDPYTFSSQGKMTGISKIVKKRNKQGVEVLRFRGCPASKVRGTRGAQGLHQCMERNNSMTSGEASVTIFAATKLPDIPSIPYTLQKQLDELRSQTTTSDRRKIKRLPQLQVSVNRDDTVIKRATKTKLNGFMAFRAFHSREISTIEHQRGISMSLATVWASDPPSQLVWQRFAAEYNQTVRYEPDLSFVDWLLSMSKGVDSKIDEPTKRTLSRAARVENIYVEKDGNLRHNTDPYALELQNKDVNNRYHNYLKERLQSAIDRPIVTLASDPSLSRSYIDPLVYEISSGTYEKS